MFVSQLPSSYVKALISRALAGHFKGGAFEGWLGQCRIGRKWFEIWSLGGEGLLEEEMAIHSSILVWRIPWTEEPGWLQSTESQRVRHDWETKQQQQNKKSRTTFQLICRMFQKAFSPSGWAHHMNPRLRPRHQVNWSKGNMKKWFP